MSSDKDTERAIQNAIPATFSQWTQSQQKAFLNAYQNRDILAMYNIKCAAESERESTK